MKGFRDGISTTQDYQINPCADFRCLSRQIKATASTLFLNALLCSAQVVIYWRFEFQLHSLCTFRRHCNSLLRLQKQAKQHFNSFQEFLTSLGRTFLLQLFPLQKSACDLPSTQRSKQKKWRQEKREQEGWGFWVYFHQMPASTPPRSFSEEERILLILPGSPVHRQTHDELLDLANPTQQGMIACDHW